MDVQNKAAFDTMIRTWMRKISCLTALLVLLPVLVPGAKASEQTKPYIEKILNYCLHYRQEAAPQIEALLEEIGAVDAGEKQTWENILRYWEYCYEELPVAEGVLPDGLPEDDSLCIVVMGYCLNRDGSMAWELTGRLRVALESAKKYPNAYILCTGGPTAADGRTTEAGQMRQWLAEQGIAWERIIVEEQSLSTTENAMYSLPILQKLYPSIEKLAIVTSDYHVRRSCLMFGVTAQYNACYDNHRPMEVVGNAAYVMGSGRVETFYTQTWGLAIVAGVELDRSNPPSLDWMPERTEVAPVESTAPETEPVDIPPVQNLPRETIPAVLEEAPEAAEPEPDGDDTDYFAVVLAIALGFGVLVTVQTLWERRNDR